MPVTRSRILATTLTVALLPVAAVTTAPPAMAACVGTASTVGNDIVVNFTGTASCTWTIPAGVTSITALVVGAGGGGGGGNGSQAGGGGGGGAYTVVASQVVTPGQVLTISQGAGGTGGNNAGSSGGNGEPSSLVVGSTTYSAAGGTGGVSRTFLAGAGGGGTSGNSNGGGLAGTTTIGGIGYTNAAGGGGATAAGSGRSGGAGFTSSITGTATVYGQGGGGGSYRNVPSTVDAQGAPNSGYYSNLYGQLCSYAGQRGGGGGGSMVSVGGVSCSGSAGGNGKVVLRYTLAPSFSLTKTASPTAYAAENDIITYTLTAKNTGSVAATNVTISDPKLPSLSCTPTQPASLAVNATLTCTGSYSVTQADVDAGSIVNTATVTGTGNGLTPTTTATATVNKSTLPGSLTLTKSSVPTTFAQAGTVLTYTLTAKNVGDGPVTGVTISDPLLPSLTCLPAAGSTLTARQSMTCQGTYTTTPTDVTNGSVTNNARVDGTAGTTPISATASTTGNKEPPNPSFSLVKTASPTSFTQAGQTMVYTLVAKNTGNVDMSGVEISDPKLPSLACTPTAPAVLPPGSTMTCSASYVTTQADVDAGSVSNTASVSGTAPGAGSPTTTPATLNSNGPPRVAAVSLAKTSEPTSFSAAGDQLTFKLVATNTGNITVSGVSIADPKVGTLNCSPAAPASLAPGQALTCLGNYTVTQTDVDNGSVSNTATASGTGADSTPVSPSASITVPGPAAAPNLSLSKTANPSVFGAVGQKVDYTLVGTNTGNVTLSGVTITDTMLGTLTCTPAAPATLTPGQAISCTGSYEVTQADVDSGGITNTASAAGTAPGGAPVNATAGPLTTPGVAPVMSLSTVKTSSPEVFSAEGDVLNYTIVVTNTGSGTAKAVSVTDPLIPGLSCVGGPDLPPGQAITCTGSYTVTSTDASNGYVDNSASVSATAPPSAGGGPVTSSGGTRVRGPIPRPDLTVTKSASPTTFDTVGQVITFTVIAANTGNVPLSGVTVSDPGADGFECSPAGTTLAVGAQITCTGTHTVTQDDIDNGNLTNSATATSTDLLGTAAAGRFDLAVPGPAPRSSTEMTKTASPQRLTAVGQKVTYTIVVKNTGNVTLRSVGVSDPLLDSPATCDVTTLRPGESATCTGTHTLTAGEANGTQLVNFASVTGTPSRGPAPSGSATATVDVGIERAAVTVRPYKQYRTIKYGYRTPSFRFKATIGEPPTKFYGPWTTAPTCGVQYVASADHGGGYGPVLPVGVYPVVCSGGVSAGGESIRYLDGTLTVVPAYPVKVYPLGATWVEGQTPPAIGYRAKGFKNGDSFSSIDMVAPTCSVFTEPGGAGSPVTINSSTPAGTYYNHCTDASTSSNYTSPVRYGSDGIVRVLPVGSSPSISGIRPAYGYARGGTKVHIYGSGFLPGTTVTIGGVTCTGVVIQRYGAEVDCYTGASAPGVVDVVVTVPGGSATLVNGYRYK